MDIDEVYRKSDNGKDVVKWLTLWKKEMLHRLKKYENQQNKLRKTLRNKMKKEK